MNDQDVGTPPEPSTGRPPEPSNATPSEPSTAWPPEPSTATPPPQPSTAAAPPPKPSATVAEGSSGPRPSMRPFLVSHHPKDSGIICSHYLTGEWCPIINCPLLHITSSTRWPTPTTVCLQWFSGRCTRDACPEFHNTRERLGALIASAAKDYCPADVLPARDAADPPPKDGHYLTAAELCGVVPRPKAAVHSSSASSHPKTPGAPRPTMSNSPQSVQHHQPPPYPSGLAPATQASTASQPVVMYQQPAYGGGAMPMMMMSNAPQGYVMMPGGGMSMMVPGGGMPMMMSNTPQGYVMVPGGGMPMMMSNTPQGYVMMPGGGMPMMVPGGGMPMMVPGNGDAAAAAGYPMMMMPGVPTVSQQPQISYFPMPSNPC